MAAAPFTARMPRPMRITALVIAYLVLTLLFVFLTFPYERLRDPIVGLLQDSTGATLRVGSIDSTFTFFGPGLRAVDVMASWPGQQRRRFDTFEVRPGWSLSWFGGVPSLHVEFAGGSGEAEGTVRIGELPAWDGELHDIDLALLPLDRALSGGSLTGIVTAEVDVERVDDGGPPLSGTIEFDARDGTFSLPTLPIAIPYETMSGSLLLGGESHAEIESLSIEGPMLRARVAGTIGGGRGSDPALDLAATIQSDASPVHSVLRRYGVEPDADGNASLTIRGTTTRPVVRAAP